MSWLSFIAELGINISPFVQGLQKGQTEATKFGKAVANRLKNSLGAAFAGAQIVDLVKDTIEYGGAITDLSERLDVSKKAIQEWNYAANQNGASAEHVTAFFEHIADAQSRALEGNTETLESFRRLGVRLKDLQTLRVEDIGKKIAESVRTGDIQKLVPDLKDIGGKSATALATAFKSGLADAAEEAHRFGAIMDDELIARMDQLGDKALQVKRTMMGWTAVAVEGIFDKVAKGAALLGAYSAQFDPKKRQFKQTFSEFLKSQDAADAIASTKDPAAAKKADTKNPVRKFTPKLRANEDILGKEIGRLPVDSFAQVGGFIGRAQQNPVVDIARQQLKVQIEIAKNTQEKQAQSRF